MKSWTLFFENRIQQKKKAYIENVWKILVLLILKKNQWTKGDQNKKKLTPNLQFQTQPYTTSFIMNALKTNVLLNYQLTNVKIIIFLNILQLFLIFVIKILIIHFNTMRKKTKSLNIDNICIFSMYNIFPHIKKFIQFNC